MNKKKSKKPVKSRRAKAVGTPTKASGKARTTSSISANTNKSGVQPLGDRVLLKPLSAEEAGTTTSFGIIIPETVDKEKPEQGTVIAVGPGKRDEDGNLWPVNVQIGDKVMFSKYGYDELKVNDVEYYIVSENNILAVLK